MKILSSLVALLSLTACVSAREIPFNLEQNTIFVQVLSARGAHPLRFVLDTGAETTVLDKRSARAVADDFGWFCWMNTECGGMRARGIVDTADLSDASNNNRHWIFGLLGADFLRNSVVTLDCRHQRLCVEPAAPHWFSRGDGFIHTPVVLPDGRTLDFIVDTGSTETFISKDAAQSLGLRKVGSCETSVVGGKTDSWECEGFAGRVNGRRIDGKVTALDLGVMGLGSVDGLLGMDFLAAHCTRLDFARHTLTVLD
jgi:predicted aspartyl protease